MPTFFIRHNRRDAKGHSASRNTWPSGGRSCGAGLAIRFPFIVLLASSVFVSAWAMADGAVVCVSLGLGWLLLALAVIDARRLTLPDWLTTALFVSGLIAADHWSLLPLRDHLTGAATGAGSLYSVNAIYRGVRGRDGLGFGDVKLAAGAGAWLGWQGMPSVIIYATLSALALVALGGFGRGLKRDTPLPFGTFICLGIWLTWLGGPILLAP